MLLLSFEREAADDLVRTSGSRVSENQCRARRAGKAVRTERAWLGLGHARAHDQASDGHVNGRLNDWAGTGTQSYKSSHRRYLARVRAERKKENASRQQ